ncbi:DUF6226 family protein [Herbiconiux sp. A18JL235]|uniref:DUF6226 family protein n=1 Tax=Herbiconiux sp. A18JL235 TaxID=3152363 RepID=A0AB39BDW7_9MICO
MSAYARPPIEPPVIVDEEGQVIEHGRRWPGSPPEESYSVDAHPERFEPLHTVAEGLIEHLRDTYDIEVTEAVETGPELRRPKGEAARAVQLRPVDPAAAPLTIVFTAYPGVFARAGLLHEFAFPVCGCDACDSTWEAEADQLEETVLAVAEGRYRESVGVGPEPWVEYALEFSNGSSSGRVPAGELPAERVRAARARLGAGAGADAGAGANAGIGAERWAPWPLRA